MDSITWLHEVYKRWDSPVYFLTHDYLNYPINRPESPSKELAEKFYKSEEAKNLNLVLKNIFQYSWGIDNFDSIIKYYNMHSAIKKLMNKDEIRIHCGHLLPEAFSAIALKKIYKSKIKLIAYAHGEETKVYQSSRQFKFLYKLIASNIDLVIANTNNTLKLLEKNIDPKKIRVIHPGVSIKEFGNNEAKGIKWRESNNIDSDVSILLTVGRLDDRKNQLAVIKSIAELKDQHKILYCIIGKGPNEELLRKTAKELNVEDLIMFCGQLDHNKLKAIYAASNIYIMPSIESEYDIEGFGITFIEAGANRKPSIAGISGGQSEAVLDEQTGLLVNGKDQTEITKALNRLLEDKGLCEEFGNNAYEYAKSHDWEKITSKTKEIVSKL